MLDLSCGLSSSYEEQYNPIGSAIDNHTGSDYNMSLIKTWVQYCQKEHQYCNTKVSSRTLPLLPTRVIEIETDGRARITETKGMQAEYLTLSYCWGHGKRLLCTRGSGLYELFKQKLPLDDTIPKTFRDALRVTEALGYRYLWIDALCIIQDDPEDVGKEMAKMGDIYRHSTLTICAANGSDTDAGLFCKRDARSSKSCNIRVTQKRDGKCLRTCVSIQPCATLPDSVLETRGWILQEEVLSGRLLFFKPGIVQWACLMTYACETAPCMATLWDQEEALEQMIYETNDAMRLMVRLPDMFNKRPALSCETERNDHFDVWYDMVAAYSRRALSVDSDKLLAVAGLASLMGKHYDLTYVTGLWKEDLQVGLCWEVTSRNDMFRKDGSRSITENFPDYLAPTWSWASAHGMCVEFFKPYLDRLPEEGIQIVDVEVSYLPGALTTFGYIKFAKLSICTRIRRIFLAPLPVNPKRVVYPAVDKETKPLVVDAFQTPTRSYIGSVSLDSVKVNEDVTKQYQAGRIVEKVSSPMESTTNEAVCTYQLSSDGYEAWCVPCLVHKDNKGNRQMILLVLTPINAERREYRRIGIMDVDDEACDMFMTGEDVHEDREIIHIL